MDIGCRRCDVLKHKMNDSICDFTPVLLHCSASAAREYLQRMMGDLESGKGDMPINAVHTHLLELTHVT